MDELVQFITNALLSMNVTITNVDVKQVSMSVPHPFTYKYVSKEHNVVCIECKFEDVELKCMCIEKWVFTPSSSNPGLHKWNFHITFTTPYRSVDYETEGLELKETDKTNMYKILFE